MTDFPMLKLKMLTNFPSQAYGGVGITINYNAGAYTINLDYSKFLPVAPTPPDLSPYYLLYWNSVANNYQLFGALTVYAPINSPVFTGDPQAPTAVPGDNDQSIATTAFVTAAITVNNGISRVVTAAGSVAIAANDRVVAINKTVGAATPVTLPLAASKTCPIKISDIKRDAGTNNITITGTSGELIQGLATLTLASNGASVELFPLPGGGYAA